MSPAKVLGTLVKAGVTTALLLLVFRSVDIEAIGGQVSRLDISLLLSLLILHWAAQAACVQRWRLLCISLGIRGTYSRFLAMYFSGMFLSTALPTVVGGDAFKAYTVSRQTGGRLSTGLASVIQDRVVGLIVLLGYGSLAVGFNAIDWRGYPLKSAYAAIWAVVGLCFLLAWKVGNPLAREPRAGFLGKLANSLSAFQQGLTKARLGLGPWLQVILISLFNSGAVIAIALLVARAIGKPVDLISLAALVPLIEIATMIPLSLSGVGIREWAYMEGLGLLGVPREAALAIGLALSGLVILRNLAGAPFLLTIRPEWRP